MELGEKIVSLRQRLNMSKRDLAKKSGIALSYLHEIERGTKSPTVHTLERLCHALGVNMAELFAEEASTLPPDLRQLLREAETLTPEQRRKLVEFIRSIRRE